MAESLRSKIVILLILLCLLFLLSSIKSCGNAYRQKSARDREMANRLDLEEQMSGVLKDKAMAEEKLKARTKELTEQTAERKAVQLALAQEQSISASLKKELERATEQKNLIEEELKACRAEASAEKHRR